MPVTFEEYFNAHADDAVGMVKIFTLQDIAVGENVGVTNEDGGKTEILAETDGFLLTDHFNDRVGFFPKQELEDIVDASALQTPLPKKDILPEELDLFDPVQPGWRGRVTDHLGQVQTILTLQPGYLIKSLDGNPPGFASHFSLTSNFNYNSSKDNIKPVQIVREARQDDFQGIILKDDVEFEVSGSIYKASAGSVLLKSVNGKFGLVPRDMVNISYRLSKESTVALMNDRVDTLKSGARKTNVKFV